MMAAWAAAMAPRRAVGQLFDNLRAFGNRLDAGDPEVSSTWRGGNEGPKGVAAGDLDGDGDADLAVGNLDGTVTVYFNRGGLEFSDPLHLRTGMQTLREVIVQDLTGDGRPDIAAAALLDEATVLFPNRGGGVFDSPIRIPTWLYARNLAAGDFNSDGILDLAVGGSGIGVRHYRGAGGGAFEAVADLKELDAGGYSKPVYVLKAFRPPGANRDELAATHAWSKQAWILAAGASGALEIKAAIPGVADVFAMDIGPVARAAASGRADLVTAHRNRGIVQVRQGLDGPARFAAAIHQEIPIPGGPRALRIADLDGDGWNDLAVVMRYLDRVLAYKNTGGQLALATEMPVGRSPRELVTAEWNGDGRPDLAVINRISSDVNVLTAYPGQAGFAALDQYYLVDGEVAGLKIADWNRDGRDDVIQLHRASGDVSIRLAGPEGKLGPPAFYVLGLVPADLVTVDVNNDGNPDVVTANLGKEGEEPGSVSVRLGDGKDGLGPERRFKLPPDLVEGRLFALEVADFDGDGIVDLAAGFFDCRLSFFKGTGDGAFVFTSMHFFLFESRAMSAGDFDQDGDIDLAGGSFTGAMAVIENRGDLLTTPVLDRKDYPPPSAEKFGTRDMVAVDINQDGDLDLLLGSGEGAMVYQGVPGMGFVLSSQALPGTGGIPATSIAAADFDGNGSPDVAVACAVLSCITLLTQGGGGKGLLPAITVDVPAGRFLAAGDLDGDKYADLVGSGEVLWTALSSRRAKPAPPPALEGLRERLEKPVINEILAVNNDLPLASDGGKKPDWVEIFNGSRGGVSLAGWQLLLKSASMPNGAAPLKYQFPGDAALQAGEHLLVVFAEARRTPYHTGFRLPGDGGSLVLLDAAEVEVDRVSYPAQRENISYARYGDGLQAFVFNNYPSPGRSNDDNGPVTPILSLDAAVPAWIAPGQPYQVPVAGAPIRFYATGKDDVGIVSASILYQRLDIPDPQIRRAILFDDGMNGDGGMQDGLFSGVLEPGLPPGGEIRFQVEVQDLSDLVVLLPESGSPAIDGEEAGFYTLAVGSRWPKLELSEVVALNETGLRDENGGTPDWVEVRNCAAETIALDGISLGKTFPANEEWFSFPPGMSLPAGGHALVFCDGNSGQGPLHAPFTLKAEGGRLLLIGTAPFGACGVIDVLEYGPQAPDTALARSGCGGPWASAAPTPGAENAPPRMARLGDADGSGRLELLDAILTLHYLFLNGALPCREAANANGDDSLDISDPIYLLIYLFAAGSPPPERQVPCG
ncbi:MAG: VCBS repeat-containing protein [Planctomycetes bacterium]|nr:VCBS repeat-containing protein [Planctomycetota bacterium]